MTRLAPGGDALDGIGMNRRLVISALRYFDPALASVISTPDLIRGRNLTNSEWMRFLAITRNDSQWRVISNGAKLREKSRMENIFTPNSEVERRFLAITRNDSQWRVISNGAKLREKSRRKNMRINP